MAEEKPVGNQDQPEEKSTPGKTDRVKGQSTDEQAAKSAAKATEGEKKLDASGEAKPTETSEQPAKSEAKTAAETEQPVKAKKPEGPAKTRLPSPKEKVAVDKQGSIWMSRRNFFSRTGWVAHSSGLYPPRWAARSAARSSMAKSGSRRPSLMARSASSSRW